MTDHRAFVAALEPNKKIILTGKSNRAGLIALGGHVGAILLVGVSIVIGGPLIPLLVLLQGILLIFLFTALHECIHRTAFQSRQLNDWVAKGCGFILVLPCEWFRLFHFAPTIVTPRIRRGIRSWPGRNLRLYGSMIGM